MRSDRTAFEKALSRHLSLFGSPTPNQLEASRARIRERLRVGDEAPVSDASRAVRGSRVRYAWRTGLSLAAAVAVGVVIVTVPWRGQGLATVEAADGSHYTLKPHTVLRATDMGGTLLTLTDGSRVEMRAQSELSLERAADGIGIRLRTGDLLVTAAKQHNGHLYVHTNDMTVAVVGTMFLVNAENLGSRVTVIDGAVRVREGTTEKSLGPGEQVSSSPALALRPMKEDIGWSRHANAILTAFVNGMTHTAAPLASSLANAAASGAPAGQAATTGFEQASIKQCDPDHLPQTPENGRGGGANSVQLTPGRLRALCVTPATLVRVAYGYNPMAQDFNTDVGPRTMTFGNVYGVGEEDGRRVRGGADWVRSERYTIEAVTGSGTTPDAPTLRGPMLQRLLERRFQLKTHIESEQAPAFALAVAKSGLKIKPVTPDACDELPARPGSTLFFGHSANLTTPPKTLADVRRGEKPTCGLWGHRNGPNQVVIGGDLPLDALILSLGMRLGGVKVVNRTEVRERFNFVLEFALDENTPGLGGGEFPDRRAELDVPAGATIFTALEEQLGLKLERAQAPREFVVIDHVERPSSN